MNLQRWDHYLSQGYQEGFTDQTGRVWVKFGNKPPEHRNPRSVGRERSLYIRSVNGEENDRVERFLASWIDAPFTSLSQRIKHERDEFAAITVEEQGALLRFVA